MSDDSILQYLNYIQRYGLPYDYSEIMHIITDYDELLSYSREHNKKLGIIYQSEYHIFIVDLVENIRGERFPYERIIKTRQGNSVVIIPVSGERFVLLKQFRHALGTYQYSFPRGFGEPCISIEENARKEIMEELNAKVSSIKIIGKVVADSGICGEEVNIVQCSVSDIQIDGVYEGIRCYELLSAEEMERYIQSDKINDGFTLSAWTLLNAKGFCGEVTL